MKKTFSIFIFALILLSFVSAWNTCDGTCTENSPGCGAYIDTNQDGLCDHGQEKQVQIPSTAQKISLSIPVVNSEHDLITGQELKTKTVKEIATIYRISEIEYAKKLSEELKVVVLPNYNFQTLHDNYNLGPSTAKEIALEMKGLPGIKENIKYRGKQYYTIPLITITILLYFLTLFLTKRGNLSLKTHRKIWNILLLIAFFGTGILGLLLVINLEFGLNISLPFSILRWHVLIGIPGVIISFFHIFWHMPYLKKMFNFNK